MNRNPARPKIMRPCQCANKYAECNCDYLALKGDIWWRWWSGAYIATALVAAAAIVFLWYVLRVHGT